MSFHINTILLTENTYHNYFNYIGKTSVRYVIYTDFGRHSLLIAGIEPAVFFLYFNMGFKDIQRTPMRS